MSKTDPQEVVAQIKMHDDTKGKTQSFTASLTITTNDNFFGIGSMETTAFGSNEEEALDHLNILLNTHLRSLASVMMLNALDNIPIVYVDGFGKIKPGSYH